MIDFLHGVLVSKTPAAVTIRMAGVGFRVLIPLSTYEALPKEGAEARLLAHLHVRENELTLYGFATELEREFFRMLLGVSHVGPMVALRVLSACPAAQFKRHVLEEDADALKAMIKGIGAKTARRLILELQGPVEELAVAPSEGPAGEGARDAVQALIALGESRAAAEQAVKAAVVKLGPDADGQKLLAEALSG
ncbi:MAG: Holliday junction branch migration protein RuvA [Candidatus Brocadiae bacterium]|nr:Holliday junction branch migration protein RuvA [Candidatus Brocadiia bacterium]